MGQANTQQCLYCKRYALCFHSWIRKCCRYHLELFLPGSLDVSHPLQFSFIGVWHALGVLRYTSVLSAHVCLPFRLFWNAMELSFGSSIITVLDLSFYREVLTHSTRNLRTSVSDNDVIIAAISRHGTNRRSCKSMLSWMVFCSFQ